MRWLKQLLCRHIASPIGKAVVFKDVGLSNRLVRNIEVSANECNKCGKLRATANVEAYTYDANNIKYLGPESDER